MLYLLVALLYVVGGHIAGTIHARAIGEARAEAYEIAKKSHAEYLEKLKGDSYAFNYYSVRGEPSVSLVAAKKDVEASLAPVYLRHFIFWPVVTAFMGVVLAIALTVDGVGRGAGWISRFITQHLTSGKLKELKSEFRREELGKEIRELEVANGLEVDAEDRKDVNDSPTQRELEASATQAIAHVIADSPEFIDELRKMSQEKRQAECEHPDLESYSDTISSYDTRVRETKFHYSCPDCSGTWGKHPQWLYSSREGVDAFKDDF